MKYEGGGVQEEGKKVKFGWTTTGELLIMADYDSIAVDVGRGARHCFTFGCLGWAYCSALAHKMTMDSG